MALEYHYLILIVRKVVNDFANLVPRPYILCCAGINRLVWIGARFAVGTAHGYGLFDYMQNKPVFVRCTLTQPGQQDASE